MTVSWIDTQVKLQALAGSHCHKVSLAGNTLPRFVLHFGERRAWPAPAGHRQTPKGEFGLYVFCAWRLLLNRNAVAGSNDSDEHIIEALQPLDGAVIDSIAVIEHTGDLVIEFDHGRTLEVFCDRHNANAVKNSPVNWSVHIQDERVRCRPGAEFVMERSRRRQ